MWQSTPRGQDVWNNMTVGKILTSPVYTGNFIARNTIKDILTNKIKASDGIRDKILIENSNPAIIDMDIFLRTQQLIEKNKPKNLKKKRNPESSFKGRIHCGYCRKVQYPIKNHSGLRYWACSVRITYPDRCPTHYIKEEIIRDMLQQGFEEWFDFGDVNTVKKLGDMIRRVNENDHFEFHRLKYLTEIEIAEHLIGSRFTADDVEEMRSQYEEFEEKINQIEDDRKYRNQALEWLSEVKDSVEFLTEMSFELMRAWVLNVTIYSEEDYTIHWIDGSETVIGDIDRCRDKAEQLRKEHQNEADGLPIKETDSILTVKAESIEDVVLTKVSEQLDGTIVNDKAINMEGREIFLFEKELIYNSRKEADIVPLATVTKIDHQQHMKMMSRIYKDIKESNIPKIKQKKKKLKVAAYVRVSTDKEEQETSLKTQKDGKVFLKLKMGLEWSAPITYENHKKLITKRRKLENFMKRLDYFNGPVIKKLIKYCKKPRTSHEMRAFMDDKFTIEHFRDVIINPLVEMGRLKRTIPEFIYSHDQKYYVE